MGKWVNGNLGMDAQKDGLPMTTRNEVALPRDLSMWGGVAFYFILN